MKPKYKKSTCIQMIIIFICTILFSSGLPAATIIDHTNTDISQIPESAIIQAKETLCIAYGHTSHGSQITTGMTGLIDFMNGRGYTTDLYQWNSSGSNGALTLKDTPFSNANDLGSPTRTTWASATRNYLDSHTDINVIMWSWCGQVSSASATDIDTYLDLMNTLEQDYPNVHFVYMTGHLDGTGETGNLHQRNQQIRDYCIKNDKILYDFADIESYDPNKTINYMALNANDTCSYDSDGNGSRDRNWATDWENNHTENIDWYQCSSAHSKSLNANQKAYAAWWLWAELAGWGECLSSPSNLVATADSANRQIILSWSLYTGTVVDGIIVQRQFENGQWDNTYSNLAPATTTLTDADLSPGIYRYRIVAYLNNDDNGTCTSSASNTVHAQIINPNAPEAPSQLQAVVNSDNTSITLTWTDNAENEDGFTLQCSINDGSWNTNPADIPANTTTYHDSNLQPGQYTYRIAAYNSYGANSSDDVSVEISAPVAENQLIRLENGNTDEVEDAFLDPENADTNYGNTNYLGTFRHFIIKFNLPESLNGKQIISANIAFYLWNLSNWQENQYLHLYPVGKGWEEASVTWNSAKTANAWTTAGGDIDTNQLLGQIELDENNWDHTFCSPINITELVQKWVDGTIQNYGVLLANNSLTSIGLKASEYSSGKRPYLEITYSDKSSAAGPNQDDSQSTTEDPVGSSESDNSDSADSDTDNSDSNQDSSCFISTIF